MGSLTGAVALSKFISVNFVGHVYRKVTKNRRRPNKIKLLGLYAGTSEDL